MKKFILNKEKTDLNPTDVQIKRQKDFSRLHHEYEKVTKRSKRPLYKDPKLFMLLFILGLVLFLMFYEG
ncbi:MAG: hypothetical protein QNL61_11480 [Crocinitomicaceae bacterium]